MDGNRMYASFGHLTGYSSNYYTYAFDKVIALDFFAQFDPADLARLRCRHALPQSGPRARADQSPAGRWSATFSAATKNSRRSPMAE